MAEMQRRVDKQGKRNIVVRFILAKGDKDKIAVWNQDLVRILHVFNVGSIGSVAIFELSSSLSDRACDRYQHEDYGHSNGGREYSNGSHEYPNDGRGYAPKYVDGAKRCFRQ
jgi:hypothetical protein